MSSSSKDEEISTTSKKISKHKRNRHCASYLTKIWEPREYIPCLPMLEEDIVFKFRNLSTDSDPEIRAISNFPLNNMNEQKSCNYSHVKYCDDYNIAQHLKQKLSVEASLQDTQEKIIKSTLQISENSDILASQIISDVGNKPGCSKEGTAYDSKQHSDYSIYRPIADNYFESDEYTSSISISDMEVPRRFEKREKKYLKPQEAKQRTNKWYQKHTQDQQRVKEGQVTKIKENEVEDWNRFRIMDRGSYSSEQTLQTKRSSERSSDKRYTIKYTNGYYRARFPTAVIRDRSRRLYKTKRELLRYGWNAHSVNNRSRVRSTTDSDISNDEKRHLYMIAKRKRKNCDEFINKRLNNDGEVVVGITEDKGNVTSPSARNNVPPNELNSIPNHSIEPDILYVNELPVASQEQWSSIIESINLRQFTELRPFISPMSTTESSDNSRSPQRRRGAHAHAHVDDAEIIMESDNNNNRIIENPANDSMLIDENE